MTADSDWGSSSVRTKRGSGAALLTKPVGAPIASGAPVALAGTSGGKGVARSCTLFVAATLDWLPSLTTNETVRLPAVVFEPAESVTAASAFCHCASVALAPEDVNVSTPVDASYEPTILPYVAELLFVNASTSPRWKPELIETVPNACAALSRSLTVTPLSIVVAGVVAT